MVSELFELELVGGATELRYRELRPEIESMPWGSIDPSAYPKDLILAAQKGWTGAAFQEYRTGAACAAMLQSLLEARAPLDLIALATRFPLDEVVHAELCARFAMSIGGAAALEYDPAALVPAVGNEADDALLKAAHQAVAFFCVGETMSVPLLHGSWKASTHPLTKAILNCIVTDEADYGKFGWAYLDWARSRRSVRCQERISNRVKQLCETSGGEHAGSSRRKRRYESFSMAFEAR
jgi:hypothetical protein